MRWPRAAPASILTHQVGGPVIGPPRIRGCRKLANGNFMTEKAGWIVARPSLLLAVASFALHALANGHYGIFRDELYFIVCGDRPDWGYVDQPAARAAARILGSRNLRRFSLGLPLSPALVMTATVACDCVFARCCRRRSLLAMAGRHLHPAGADLPVPGCAVLHRHVSGGHLARSRLGAGAAGADRGTSVGGWHSAPLRDSVSIPNI